MPWPETGHDKQRVDTYVVPIAHVAWSEPLGCHYHPSQPPIVEGERRLSRVRIRIRMRVPWEHWHDIYNEVIDPLRGSKW